MEEREGKEERDVINFIIVIIEGVWNYNKWFELNGFFKKRNKKRKVW